MPRRPPPSRPPEATRVWPHRLPGPPVVASFVARPNRFLAVVTLPDGSEVEAHVPDRGRLSGLLQPGSPVLLFAAPEAARRTRWSMLAARDVAAGTWVATDPAHANKLAGLLLEAGALSLVDGSPHWAWPAAIPGARWSVRREVTVGDSRFDFRLDPVDGIAPPVLLEVKSLGLVRGGRALFPDAPTTRGERHLEGLAEWVRSGHGSASVLFVVQRGDASVVSPNVEVDPAFARTLRRVSSLVHVAAAAFDVTPEGLSFRGFLPVEC